MKIYISADIEGITGIAHWDEATRDHPAYAEFQQRMTAETAAACEAALGSGAQAIVVKDAHGTGRNILAEQLPAPTQLIRGWSGHPYGMVQGWIAASMHCCWWATTPLLRAVGTRWHTPSEALSIASN